MNDAQKTPPKPSSITVACIRGLRSRQEAVACIWAALIIALVSALLQFWPGVGALLGAAAYWGSLRWMDKHNAWQIPPREDGLASDILRVLANALLSIAMIAVLFLFAVAALTQGVVGNKVLGWSLIIFALLFLVGHYFYSRNRKTPSWRATGLSWLIVGPVCAYLFMDDAEFTRPLTLAELSPPPAQAEASWATVLWYVGHDGQSAARQLSSPGFAVLVSPTTPEKTSGLLEKNREKIQAGWVALASEREWFAAMNEFPIIADLTRVRQNFVEPSVKFSPYQHAFRAVLHTGCAEAGLLALDGKGDDAIGVLLPLVGVSRKLEPAARTLTRALASRTAQRQVIDTARFIIARTSVSPERRAALAAALETGMSGADGIRHMLWLDYAWSYDFSYQPGLSREVGRSMSIIIRPFNLPRTTANVHAAYLENIVRLAEARAVDKMDAAREELSAQQGGFNCLRNPFGNLIFLLSLPSYTKEVETYWKTEDARLALIAELRHPAPAATK